MAHCAKSLSRSWSKTISILFQPFRLVFWLKMALIVFIMNQFSNYQFLGQGYRHFIAPYLPKDPTQLGQMDVLVDKSMEVLPLIIAIAVVTTLVMILLTLLKAILNFVFYSGVWLGVVYMWKATVEYFGQILSYFLWNVLFSIFLFVVILLFFGFMGFLTWGMDAHQGNTTGLIIAITLFIGFVVVGGLFLLLYYVLLEAMVVPHMLVKKMGILQAWSHALGLAFRNLWEFLGFVLIRMVINLIIALIMTLFTFAIILIVSIIFGLLLGMTGTPVSELSSFNLFDRPVMYLLLIPFSFFVNCILLPVPIFYNMYALCFNAALTEDHDFDPQSAPTSQQEVQKPEPEPTPILSEEPQKEKESGPLHFSEIPVENDTWGESSTFRTEQDQENPQEKDE